MITSERMRGHVIGKDNGVFKVRVQGGPLDGTKLRVVSTHDDCSLAIRLEVDFLVGLSQGRDELCQVAVDVRPVLASPKCDRHGCNVPSEVYMEVSQYEADGFTESKSAQYWRSCLPHFLHHARQATSFVKGTPIIKVINVARGDSQWCKLET